jgi:large subunit ribosomal protein L25
MTFALSAKKRDAGEAQAVREAGMIPAVVYGPEIEPQSVSFDYNTFEKLYKEAGESTMIDLSIDGGEAIKVLIQARQYEPVKNTITHVDFRQIKMGEEMSATISLEIVGEAPVVKTDGGTLNLGVREVNVRCLPKDLVSSIEVDLSVLATFEDTITIADVKLPEGMTSTDEPNTLVATVTAPLSEEQLAAMEETQETSVEDVEVEEKGKKEDGEAEGEGEEKKEEAK